MTIVNVHEAKTQLSKLLERVHAGEEIVIAKNGRPYARLVPLEKPKVREPGLLKGKVEDSFFEPLPDDELRQAPREGEPSHPLFAALMAMTSESERFQADLSESFGPEEAKRVSEGMRCSATVR